jgi:hypothetical protein
MVGVGVGIQRTYLLNLVKEENSDLFADTQSNFDLWKNKFCQLLNIYGVNVSQTEVYPAEQLVRNQYFLKTNKMP